MVSELTRLYLPTIPFSCIIIMLLNASVSGFSLTNEDQITNTIGYEFSPICAIDSDGFTHMVYSISPNYPLLYRKVDLSGRTTVGPINLTDEKIDSISYGDIEIDENGRIHVMFVGRDLNDPERNQREIFYSRLNIDGTLMNTQIKVTNTTHQSSHVRMDLDLKGNVYFVWREITTPPKIMRSAILSNGSISEPIIISGKLDSGGEVHNPDISIDSNNDNVILWQQKNSEYAKWEIYYSKISPSGRVIIAPEPIIYSPEFNYEKVRAEMDTSDNLHIVFLEESEGQTSVQYAIIGDNHALQKILCVSDSIHVGTTQPLIILTPQGDKVFLYMVQNMTDDRSYKIVIRVLSADNDAWLMYAIRDYEEYSSSPQISFGYDQAAILFIRNGEIFRVLLDTSISNFPPVPILTFKPSSPLVDEIVTFFGNASEDPDENDHVKEYMFDWGDGNSTGWQTSSTADYQFTLAGLYTVSLYVRDTHGLACDTPAQIDIEINDQSVLSPDQSFPLKTVIVIIAIIILLTIISLQMYKWYSER